MVGESGAASAGFNADQTDLLVGDKFPEDADGVRSAAHAGDDGRRQFAFRLQNLRAGFAPDHGMEIADHGGIRMRAERAAQQVVRGPHVGDPVAYGFIDGVFQSLRPGTHAPNLRAQQPHAEYVKLLTAHVLVAHMDDAFQTKQRADGGRGHPVLPRAGFGDDAMLAHAPGEQCLPDAVVRLGRAGMQQSFALQVDFRAAQLLRQPFGKKQRRRTPGVFPQQALKFGLEFRIFARLVVLALQFLQGPHERLGDIPSAVLAKPARHSFLSGHSHVHDCSALRTAATNAFIFSGSLRPGSRSTPVTTSTPQGEKVEIASPTFSGFNPPATISRMPLLLSRGRTACQSKVRPLPAPASSSMESMPAWFRQRFVKRSLKSSFTMMVLITPIRGSRGPRANSSATSSGVSSPCSCTAVSPACSTVCRMFPAVSS